PSGTHDMLDWMTMDSDLRSSKHLTGSANPLYTLIHSGKFYWTKGGNGYPWDIELYDNNYIYHWLTEYAWNYPTNYKKSSNNYNSNYGNCGDKEEYYLSKRYGLVQWVHYTLSNGNYHQQQKSVFNQLTGGTTSPKFVCF